jgi:hypothetical protein
MSSPRDITGSDDTIDSISLCSLEWSDDVLSGRVAGSSDRDELADVLLLVHDARRSVENLDLDDPHREQTTIAAMLQAFDDEAPAHLAPAERKFRARRVGRRIAVLGVAGALSISAAAAATGSLPGPIQAAVARSVGQVGVDLPDGQQVVEQAPTATDGDGEPRHDAPAHEPPTTSTAPQETGAPSPAPIDSEDAGTPGVGDPHGPPTSASDTKPGKGEGKPPQANGQEPARGNGPHNGETNGAGNGNAFGAENGNANSDASGSGSGSGNGPKAPPGQTADDAHGNIDG